MQRDADTIVVGAGIAGLATAYHLVRRGSQGVLVLERERAPARHSSAKSAAILRTAVPEPAVAALTGRSAAFLAAPPAELFGAEPLVDGRGLVLVAGSAGAAELARLVDACAPHAPPSSAPAVRLDAAGLHALAPEVRHPHGDAAVAFHFPAEGRIDFERLLAGLERGAVADGARLRTESAVAELLVEGGRVAGVRLASGASLRAERVVLAAGAWAERLGRAAGSRVRLEATRRHLAIAFLEAPARADAPIVWDLEGRFYARPERGGWLVCICDRSSVADPDAPAALEPDPAVLAALRERASRYLGAAPLREETWSGLRTMTADDEFAIGADPDVAGLHWVAGLGGAGMGAGFAAGELAAALVAGERSELAAATDPARLAVP